MEFRPLNGNPPDILEIKRRKQHVENIIVQHPRYLETYKEIEEYHLLSTTSKEPKGLFIYGNTGVGKSSILTGYADRYPKYEDQGITKVPILYSIVPVGATPKSVASSILSSLGDPNFDRGSENDLTERLLKFIAKDICDVQMIIIDEFQHIIDRETEKVLKKASDWLKSFSDKAGIPMIICGLPESMKIFERNEQLDRRFSIKHPIKKFEYQTKEEQLEFRGFLNVIAEMLPFYSRSNLADKHLSEKIYYASRGVPYYIKLILIEATVCALKSGRDSIDEIDLSIAFDRINISSRKFAKNPFKIEKFNLWDEIQEEFRRTKKAENEAVKKGKRGKFK